MRPRLVLLALLLAFFADALPASAASPLKVVQLGDSYSAGNGADHYYGPKDCYRSTASYARKWVAKLSTAHSVTFVNRACSGGVLDNLDHRRYMDTRQVSTYVLGDVEKDDPDARRQMEASGRCGSPYRDDEDYELEPTAAVRQLGGTVVYYDCKRYMDPQWDAVDKSTDVVLFTIGGNDLHFADIVKECFVIGVRDPHDCKDKIDAANRDLPGLGARTQSFLARLKARMRDDAKILLLSYPYLEKDDGLTLGRSFLGIGTVYDVGHQVRALGRAGDEAQHAAVDGVNGTSGTRVVYLDAIKDLFKGHEPDGRVCCKNDDRWLNEPTDSTSTNEWYHYNPDGHSAIGGLLSGYGDFGAGHVDPTGAAGIDVAFVIDTTGSMGSSIDAVKETATELVTDIKAQTTSARFALIDYRDFASRTGTPDDYPAKLDSDFTANTENITTAIQDLSLGYGGDTPETMFSGLHMAYGLTWRPGVKKLTVVLTDAPPLSPEPITDYSVDDILQESLAIDPVEFHLVDVGGGGGGTATRGPADTPDTRKLAQGTNGGVYDSTAGDAAEQIAAVVDASLDQPYAWLAGPYVGKVGSTFTLDGSGSYGIGSAAVTSYEWDFDGDGTFDQTTTSPTVSHTYPAEIDGLAALRVTDSAGRTGFATTPVRVSDDGDEVARADDNCPDVANPGQEDEDADGIGNACDATPGFATTDKEGVYETTTTPSGTPGPSSTPAPTVTATPAPTTTPAPTVKRRARLRIGTVRVRARGKRVVVAVRCRSAATGGRCRGTLRVKVGRRKATVRYRIAAGRQATVVVRAKGALRRALRHRPSTLRLRLADRSGTVVAKTVRLR